MALQFNLTEWDAPPRHRCGFDVFKGLDAVPSECAYTRFQHRLFR